MAYIQKETGKDKFRPRSGHEGPDGEEGYTRSSNFSLTSAVDSGQRHAPAAIPPRKIRYPLYRRMGGHRVGQDRYRKCRPPPGFDPAPSSPQRITMSNTISRPTTARKKQPLCRKFLENQLAGSINNSHNKTNKCTNVQIIYFYTQFVVTPTRFDLS